MPEWVTTRFGATDKGVLQLEATFIELRLHSLVVRVPVKIHVFHINRSCFQLKKPLQVAPVGVTT